MPARRWLLGGMLIWLGLGLCQGASVFAAQKLRIKAVLIKASNEQGPSDPRLKHLEKNLHRLFNYKRYQQAGARSVKLDLPGKAEIKLGPGGTLHTEVNPAEGNTYRAKIRWERGGKTLIHTTVKLKKNVPTIMGGPKEGNQVLMVALTVR